MRATTICPVFCYAVLCCLAPLRLAADSPDAHARTHPPASAAKSETPRRLPAFDAAAQGERQTGDSGAAAAIEQAAFAESPAASGARSRLPPRKTDSPRILPQRSAGKAPAQDGQADERGRALGAASSMVTSLASLAVVLGLFFAVAWAMRRGMPPGAAVLPREAVEVLGRTPLTPRQQAHLVRCGNKVLLVYLAQGVAETLTEITDPLEVDRLVGLCRQAHPQSTTASFRQILQQFSREKRIGGG